MNENGCIFGCRQCREILFRDENIITCSPVVEESAETLWYLDLNSCPGWIQAASEEAGNTQGKLFCPRCHNKVGVFNNTSYSAEISSLQVEKCKVDTLQQSLYSDQSHSESQATDDISSTMATTSDIKVEGRSYHVVTGASYVPSTVDSSSVKPSESQLPHRRSLSTGALRPLLETASNFNSSLSLTNPLSLLGRGESERSDCEQQTDEAGSSLLDNLFAIGQAAVEAANLAHGANDNSDDDISQGASQHSDEHGSQQDLRQIQDNTDRNQNSSESSEVALHYTDNHQNAPDVVPDRTENYQLMCPVCLEHYYNPHKCLPCKHVFCDPCLRRMRKTDVHSPTKCPLCRVVIKKCVPHSGLSSTVTSLFPDTYRSRHKLEKKQKHKLPPLPGEAITVDNRFGQNMLATWSAVCGIVLLMMFVFCVFASLVGFVLWYTMEVVLDVVGELLMEISDLFSLSWQALIILCLEGQMPHNIIDVLSECAGRIFGTLSQLVERTKVFLTEGEVTPPPPVTFYVSNPEIQFNNHTQVLTKVAQADLVNYVFLAGLVTYLFYRIGRYLQNMNIAQVR